VEGKKVVIFGHDLKNDYRRPRNLLGFCSGRWLWQEPEGWSRPVMPLAFAVAVAVEVNDPVLIHAFLL